MPRNPPPESQSLGERIFGASSTSRGIYIHVSAYMCVCVCVCVCVSELFIARRDRAGNVKRLAVSLFEETSLLAFRADWSGRLSRLKSP